MSAVVNSDLARFSREISALDMKPLWERVMRLKPGTAAQAAIWRWSEVRPLLMRSCELITAKQAERRVLMLENPALTGSTFITPSLYAGLQAILPGEVAPTHRHTPNALRFIVEGEGAYTTVEGERIAMRPGDFVVTPGWTWHDHGNTGSEPVIWLDGLDTAFANIMGAHFREDHPGESRGAPSPAESRRLSVPDVHSVAHDGASLLAMTPRPQGQASAILSYPYERTRAALERLSKDGAPHPAHGWKLRYVNPENGGHAFPTMAAFMQLLPRGFEGRDYRSTDGAVFCVVEGKGGVSIGDARSETRFDIAPNDVFVIPSWESYRFNAGSDCVIFSYSDRAAQESLGFWREQI